MSINNLEYLFFNLFIFCGILVVSYVFGLKRPDPKKYLWSFLVVGGMFVAWDQVVTGVFWTFNPGYILGAYVHKLPIEEILFFATVPYACTVVYINFFKSKIANVTRSIIFAVVSGIILLSLNFWERQYTAQVLGLLGALIMVDLLLVKSHHILSTNFLAFLAVVCLLTFVFNYYLTSRPVVVYDLQHATGYKILTIPIEDFVYGLNLIYANILFASFYEQITKRINFKI